MSRPFLKLPALTYRRLDQLLPRAVDRDAWYVVLQEAKLAESEGEWASEADLGYAIGRSRSRSVPVLIEKGLLERTPEGWVRLADYDSFTVVDPTNAERQKRWRARRKAELEASRNALRKAATVTNGKEREERREAGGVTGAPTEGAPDAEPSLKERVGWEAPAEASA